jgi:hypothetical protein
VGRWCGRPGRQRLCHVSIVAVRVASCDRQWGAARDACARQQNPGCHRYRRSREVAGSLTASGSLPAVTRPNPPARAPDLTCGNSTQGHSLDGGRRLVSGRLGVRVPPPAPFPQVRALFRHLVESRSQSLAASLPNACIEWNVQLASLGCTARQRALTPASLRGVCGSPAAGAGPDANSHAWRETVCPDPRRQVMPDSTIYAAHKPRREIPRSQSRNG